MMLLSLIVWPLVASLLLYACRRHRAAAQWMNLGTNVVWAGIFVCVWQIYQAQDASVTMPISFSWDWLPVFKSRFNLGVDSLSFPLIALNVFLSITLALYSIGKEKIGSAYLATFSALNAASVGSLMAGDALSFYVFWEFMLIPMYFLIGRWGGKNRVYAALKFFAMTMTGSLLMLLSIVALLYVGKAPSLAWHDLVALNLPFDGMMSVQGLIFLGFLIAFAVKIPVWPVHTWLPDAHTEAPTGGSVILAGVLLKLGVYGIVRWCFPIFPEASKAAAPVMQCLAVAGILLGAFAAWKQTDVKKMIAYSSVSHLGFMVLGIFALNVEGLQGALFQNIAHGLSTGALFLMFGMIYDRTHTREMSDYGGLAVKTWPLAACFVFTTMASIGLPGLPGFVGEFLVLSGAFGLAPWHAVLASLGILLGAIYMLTLVRKVVYGRESAVLESHPVNLSWSEWAALAPYLAAMLVLGLMPQLLIGRSEALLQALAQTLR